jgi:regulator of sigma E protease
MVFVQDALAVIFVLGVMILVHELGHFLAARHFDVRVDVFSFGFGPRLFGKTIGETDYRVCAFPLGGYVKMAGEQPGDERSNDPREFLSKPRWQRLIIAVMGPVFNVLLAIGLLVGLYMVRFERLAMQTEPAVLGGVAPNSPAAQAGLREGDRISVIDGKQNPTWEDVYLKVVASAKQPLHLTVERNGKTFDAAVTPTADPVSGVGYAGWSERVPIQAGELVPGLPAQQAGLKKGDLLVAIDGEPIQSPYKLPEVLQRKGGQPVQIEYLRDGQRHTTTLTPVFRQIGELPASWKIGVDLREKQERVVTRLSFGEALQESIEQNRKNATLIFQFLRGLLQRRMSPKSLEGPIGIARLSGQAARQGSFDLMLLMSAISLNLGIFNLLPIPILDGGVIVLLLFESLIGRDISLAVKERIVQVGFVFLMLLFVFVIYNDIMKSLARG